jgi:hypothetical protein
MQLINRFNYDTMNRVLPGMLVPICDWSNETSAVFRSSPVLVGGVAASDTAGLPTKALTTIKWMNF